MQVCVAEESERTRSAQETGQSSAREAAQAASDVRQLTARLQTAEQELQVCAVVSLKADPLGVQLEQE